MEENCVFCKIVRGEIPANKIAEDDDFLAFLGISPKFPGMTVIVTKDHLGDSYLYKSVSDEKLAKMHVFAKNVALAIDKALGSFRCIQVMEGLENRTHPHLKLFPVYEGKSYGVAFEGSEKTSDEELKVTLVLMLDWLLFLPSEEKPGNKNDRRDSTDSY